MSRPLPPGRHSVRLVVALCLALLSWSGSGCSRAETPPPRKSTVTFPSLAEGWTRVEGSLIALRAAASTGDLKVAAGQARQLADMAGGLIPLSGAYVSARESPLEFAVADLGRLAGELQAAADKGDRNAAVDVVIRIRRALRYIHGLYPAGVLPPMLPE